jgi:hypothetical protein
MAICPWYYSLIVHGKTSRQEESAINDDKIATHMRVVIQRLRNVLLKDGIQYR